MPTSRWTVFPALLVALFFLHRSALVAAQGANGSSLWRTLDGSQPLVVARGGFSGAFPDSSQFAYTFAVQTSLPNAIQWCDVRLTKDNLGVCLPDLKLSNCTAIDTLNGPSSKVTMVNDQRVTGWLSIDFTLAQLEKIPLIQGIFSRTEKYDGLLPVMSVTSVGGLKPPGLWLNVQHDLFYKQHNLSMRRFLLSISKQVIINYISSPEVAFLKDISIFRTTKTRLIFRFLNADMTEPTTNQTYSSLRNNLTFISTFASGILVPKGYIWPIDGDNYRQASTSLVMDAHKVGLQVFAADFQNDAVIAYDYDYNPINEYLSFVDGNFSVDGVLTDHPITASEAIGCFAHTGGTTVGSVNGSIIISNDGASGVFPGSTDLAYKKAIDDGADYIDCLVQVTQDGKLICLSSINLLDCTTVSTSPFGTRTSNFPEIQSGIGIYTFNLTWEEIQTNLKPMISSPQFSKYRLVRNPKNKNVGQFVTLADFLTLAKSKDLTGIMIKIEHAAFLAKNLGISITDSVLNALDEAGYNNQTSQKVMIQSSNSSVLVSMRKQSKYELVYKVDELISDAVSSSIQDIKKFADAVAVNKLSIFPTSNAFVTSQTKLVNTLLNANLSVFAYTFMNEFVSQPWDFFSDPVVEINNYFQGALVSGIISDFPATASAYRKNTCLRGTDQPAFMLPVQPGGLLSIMSQSALPPVQPPFPSLTESDVLEPPLPPVSAKPLNPAGAPPAPGTAASGGQPRAVMSLILWAILVGSFLLLPFNH